jgi:hypothetical protein
MNTWKKMLVSTLAVSLVAGGASSAFAAKPDWAGKSVSDRKDRANGKKDKDDDGKVRGIHIEVNGKTIELKFDDVRGEAAWALHYIAELVKRGVFTGYEDGSFRPNQKVTRIEAITAAVRQMGLRAQAESAEEMATALNFKDADKIGKKYPWAVGYVAVALENDLFIESENEVQPEKPADRQWAAVLLVKSLGLEAEARAKMNTDLSFKDKKEIDAGAVGYIAVALEKGLITGYDNHTFRPNQPITRAEMAALLDRTGDHIPDSETGYGQVSGTYTSLSNGKLTLTKDGKAAAYTVSQDVAVVRNNTLVSLSSLVAGDQINAVVVNGVVIYVSATQSGGVADGQKTGTVTAVTSQSISITENGRTVEYSVASNASIIRNSVPVNLNSVVPGDRVEAVVTNGAVIFMTVTDPVSNNNNAVYSVEGKYQGHRMENGKVAQISVTTQQDGSPTTRIYNVASDAVINGGNAFSLVAGETTIELVIINQVVSILNFK